MILHLLGYTGPGTTWCNEMNGVMNHAPGAGSIDLSTSALPRYHGCLAYHYRYHIFVIIIIKFVIMIFTIFYYLLLYIIIIRLLVINVAIVVVLGFSQVYYNISNKVPITKFITFAPVVFGPV